jgi:hypothetical protein
MSVAVLSCDHPRCENEVVEVFPARLRENTYCSAVCRERHTKLLTQQRRREHPERGPHDNFNRRFRRYGITQEEFERIYDLQLGRCAICLLPLSETRVHVDHCHNTDVVRGLLCNLCNPGLGYFQDDPDLLMKAAEYLRGTE